MRGVKLQTSSMVKEVHNKIGETTIVMDEITKVEEKITLMVEDKTM